MANTSFACYYATLRAAQWPSHDAGEAFDLHVLSCTLAIAMAEASGRTSSLADCLGLTPDEIGDVFDRRFPILARGGFLLSDMPVPVIDDEQHMLRDLLIAHRATRDAMSYWLACIIARRAMEPDHLWQDLGLNDRGELNRLLQRHFPSLHAGNTNNMKWKKYFYRKLCEAEGFTLCTAPSCGVCADFSACFGEEDGMSRLGEIRAQEYRAAS